MIDIYINEEREREAELKSRIGWKACIIMGTLTVGLLIYLLYNRDSNDNNTFIRTMAMENTKTSKEDKENKGKIALTFDDGPHPFYTEQLLDGLKKRDVKATFFVTGAHAELHPDIVKRMSEEGHCVGNHTYSHLQLKASNKEEFKKELIKTNEIITGITGEEVLYVRPPYGTWDKKIETELNMFPVLWNVDPLDWCSNNVSCITNKVVKKVRENGITLMHG